MQRTCRDCRFWVAMPGAACGRCWRNPGSFGQRPETARDSWCGEWRRLRVGELLRRLVAAFRARFG